VTAVGKSAVSAARLREAREYIGFSRADVAEATGWPIDRIVTLEDGTASTITGEELRKLSRLYRRPVAWLQGETTFRPSPDLLRRLEHLTPGDREAILDFHEWLQGAGPAPKPRRDRG
jgi:transcriptional regulator with XRE-family HTH domain